MYIFDISVYGLHIAPTWYGLSYAIWFIICYFFIKNNFYFKKLEDSEKLLTYIFFGVIFGGRIGYILLYNMSYFIENPIQIFRIWEWWMSFHWGFLGTIIAILIYSRIYKYKFWELIDTLAIIIPIAIWLGRIWNWMNKELPGYAPYNGIFPMNIWWINHFPSPLFEMLLEGIILFIVMIIFYKKNNKSKAWFYSWLFLVGYSVARVISEQFRLPDTHIWYIFSTDFLTLWILYTIPMFFYWIYLIYARK
jgi:phosphatidylglycerol:prolipoprotein diacylglycerol transferase